RRARRLQHPVFGQLLGVRVAGGVAAQDAHAEPQRHAAPDRADPSLLEHEVGARAVLEVEIGVLTARAERRNQQPLGQPHIDGVERRGGDHVRAGRAHRLTSGPWEGPAPPALDSNEQSSFSSTRFTSGPSEGPAPPALASNEQSSFSSTRFTSGPGEGPAPPALASNEQSSFSSTRFTSGPSEGPAPPALASNEQSSF